MLFVHLILLKKTYILTNINGVKQSGSLKWDLLIFGVKAYSYIIYEYMV